MFVALDSDLSWPMLMNKYTGFQTVRHSRAEQAAQWGRGGVNMLYRCMQVF